MASETGATSATPATHDSLTRSADLPASATAPGAIDNRGLWVDNGCRADFAFGGGGGFYPQPGGPGQGTIRCSSDNGKRNWCDIGNARDAQLVKQVSGSPCVRGSTWGIDNRGLWVDNGCRADFASAAAVTAHRPHSRRSSPAPPITERETGVTSAAAATSASTVKSAAQPAFRARPGASTIAASGSTAAAAPSSASAIRQSPQEPLPPKWLLFHLTSLKPPEKNPSAS